MQQLSSMQLEKPVFRRRRDYSGVNKSHNAHKAGTSASLRTREMNQR